MNPNERALFEALQTYQEDLGDTMHDSLSQSLSGALLMARVLAKSAPDPAVGIQFGELGETLAVVLDDCARIARSLRPLQDAPSALMEGIAELARNARTPCEFICQSSVLIDDRLTAIALYRIAELLVSRTPGTASLRITLAPGSLAIQLLGGDTESWGAGKALEALACAACAKIRRKVNTEGQTVEMRFGEATGAML